MTSAAATGAVVRGRSPVSRAITRHAWTIGVYVVLLVLVLYWRTLPAKFSEFEVKGLVSVEAGAPGSTVAGIPVVGTVASAAGERSSGPAGMVCVSHAMPSVLPRLSPFSMDGPAIV